MASKIIVDQLEKSGLTTLTLPLANATANQIIENDGAGALSWVTPASAGNTVKVACLVDEKAANTDGGTFTQDAWQQRDLQTEYYDTIGISFGTNTFILPAGTFYFDWSCPGFDVRSHQTRLYNITAAGVVKPGSVEYADSSTAATQNRSFGSAAITLVSTATFKIEHRCQTTKATEGFGISGNLDGSTAEVYTIVNVMQIS
tara:strand:- start:342 stop:947 length:606 start_codon:yes stop_codon:yes gene_type:complete